MRLLAIVAKSIIVPAEIVDPHDLHAARERWIELFADAQARIEMANKPWVRITGVTVCSLIVLVYAMARYQHAH